MTITDTRPQPAASRVPTSEQQAIITAYSQRKNLVVNAYAGSGKTTILKMLAASDPRRQFTYLAYNAAAKKEAAAAFPANAHCLTTHGLAYRPMITMAKRVSAGKKYLPSAELARMMRITGPQRLTGNRVLSPGQLAVVVKATIKKFCYSADDAITRWHVPRDMNRFTDPAEIEALQHIVPPVARRVWEQVVKGGENAIPMEHDYYLKAYALTHPVLPGDVLALDEAQDSNPCVAAMVMEQIAYGKQVIMVGDTYQAIYGWRGAVDAMAKFSRVQGVTVLSLTQSFRFGPSIAEEANKWLRILGADLPLRGNPAIRSRVGQQAGHPDALLCRTNAEALKRAIGYMGDGLKVAFPKGTGELIALAKGARNLKAGQPCDHPDLLAFTSWGQVQDFVENEPDGEDLKRFVELVDEHGVDGLLDILFKIGNADKGADYDVVVGTAHGAKGLEWPITEIACDFREPKKDPERPDELPQVPRDVAMLAYVAVTRPRDVLNRAGLAWVDNYLPGGAQ